MSPALLGTNYLDPLPNWRRETYRYSKLRTVEEKVRTLRTAGNAALATFALVRSKPRQAGGAIHRGMAR